MLSAPVKIDAEELPSDLGDRIQHVLGLLGPMTVDAPATQWATLLHAAQRGIMMDSDFDSGSAQILGLELLVEAIAAQLGDRVSGLQKLYESNKAFIELARSVRQERRVKSLELMSNDLLLEIAKQHSIPGYFMMGDDQLRTAIARISVRGADANTSFH
jgi:hypothetical protein